jgi:receptor protein-tyrosine kinase
MLIPKASHLVERVAERLLRSGGLEPSAAQLLRPSEPSEPVTQADPPPRPGASLFAPPPFDAPPAAWTPAERVQAPRTAEALADGFVDELPAYVTETDQGFEAAHFAPPAIRPVVTPAPAVAPVQPAPAQPQPHPATARDPEIQPAPGRLEPLTTIDAVSLERAGMVDWSRTRSRISEEFRLVQRQILRSAFGPGAEPGFSNLLLVTSARPGEGKSFMSLNMAGSIARQGDNHVLLVDADSKRDSICYSLGLAQARGLLDLAANPKLDPAPLIVKSPIERLSILPVGRERERSAELFSTKEMTRVIQSLGRRYADRLLILDAPPCLSTSDPALLAQVVGQILFVVEADRTQRDEVEASLDLIQACPTITMVLNKQQISSRYTFGAYSSYYSS